MGQDKERTNEKDYMTYAGSGVDYSGIDPFKVQAQIAAAETASNAERLGFREVKGIRGESAYLMESINYDFLLAQVIEGLGTKNMAADRMRYQLSQKVEGVSRSFYDSAAQCTVAMIVNDMITLGALPLAVGMHLAIDTDDWFENEQRSFDLIEGWKKACHLARCNWGGGETPVLKGLVVADEAILSGAAKGIIEPKSRIITPDQIQEGDSIVVFESSGVHANGLTLARDIADKLPDGYLTELPNGCLYGDALLEPTHIYVGAVEDCLDAGIDIHYTVNITGHGWRKFMRANEPFTYVIDRLPTQLPIFDFIQEQGPVERKEMYGNYNMGAGFALYVSEPDAGRVCSIVNSGDYGFRAFRGGRIEEGDKQVVIKPEGITFKGDTLAVR